MNKKKLGLIILITLTSLNLFGQFEIGVKGGPSISNITNKDVSFYLPDKMYPVIGFNFGLYTQLDFTDKLHLNSDLLLSLRGYKIEDFFKTEIIYLEIPVLLSYSIIEKLEIEFGPNLGVRLTNNYDFIDIVSRRGYYKPLDLALTLGLRYKLSDEISLSGRYYHGLTSIGALFSQESKSFNRAIQFSVGCKIK